MDVLEREIKFMREEIAAVDNLSIITLRYSKSDKFLKIFDLVSLCDFRMMMTFIVTKLALTEEKNGEKYELEVELTRRNRRPSGFDAKEEEMRVKLD